MSNDKDVFIRAGRGGHVARHVGKSGRTPARLVVRKDAAPPAPIPAHGSPGASAPFPPVSEKR